MTDLPGIAEEDLINFGQTGEYGAPNIPAWKKSAGFAPLETLPAAWFNGYMNELDTHINQLQNLTLQIQTEMANLMAAASVTPSGTNLTQIRQSIQALIQSSDDLRIAPEFDADESYSVGQYVLYNDYLYICTTAHTGAWNAAHFSVTKVGTKLTELKTAIDSALEAIGDLSSLSTTDKTNLVSAINEVDGHADDNAEAIGNLNSLSTTAKTDLVSAINEVDARAASSIQYSMSEFDTGKKWVDSKKIYGRVLVPNSLAFTQNTSLPTTYAMRSLGVFNGTLYVGTNGHGIYTSTDGSTFTQNTSFPTGINEWAITDFNGTLYVGTGSHGIYTSTDGSTFTQNTSFPTTVTVWALAVFNGTLYVGTGSHGIYTSTDGSTFTRNTSYPTNAGNTDAFGIFNNTLYASSDYGIYTSTDGSTFRRNTSFPTTRLPIQAITDFNGTLYVGTDFGIYTSTDGSTFTRNTSFPTTVTVWALAVFNGTLYVATGVAAGSSATPQGIYTSTDGSTFTQNTSFPTNYSVTAFAIFNNTLYVGTHGYGIYMGLAASDESVNDISTLLFVQLRNASGPLGCEAAWIESGKLVLKPITGIPTQAIIEYTKQEA